jgi:ankyrin repeat protein
LVQFLIDRGADFNATLPNGYTVLEHILVRENARYHISRILPYVQPPKKLWVAAALGDVKEMRRYFGRDGKLNDAGRRNRPDLTAIGPFGAPMIPDPSDLTLLSEIFVVAMLNEQYESMAFLIEHGFPVDHPSFGWTAMWVAVNKGDDRFVEFLLKHGAKPSLKGAETPEEQDQWLFEADPTDEKARRIYELCGGTNADAVLERYRALQQTPPPMNAMLVAAIDRAKEEAERLGQTEVTDDNLFLGLLRDEERRFAGWLGYFNIRMQELKAAIEDRLVYARPNATRDIPFGAEAQASIDAAIARRQTMHWREVNGRDLLWALVMKDSGPVIDLLVRHGADMAKMRESLAMT